MRFYEDPALRTTDPNKDLTDFVGTYKLSPGNRRAVELSGTGLFTVRNGQKTGLLPESGDLFFRTGVESRVFFHRDASRKVDPSTTAATTKTLSGRKCHSQQTTHS
jgi:hypothetical protein